MSGRGKGASGGITLLVGFEDGDRDSRDREWKWEGNSVDLAVSSDHVVVDEFFHDFLLETLVVHHTEQLGASLRLRDESDEQQEGAGETEDDDGSPHVCWRHDDGG